MVSQKTTLLSIVLIALTHSSLFGIEPESSESGRHWSKEIIALAASLPIQEGGRIKPLDTFAQFKLLRYNGRRKCTNSSGEKLSSTEWLLDCIFYPEKARKYAVFLVQNHAVLDAIKVSHSGHKKRDRYSYAELAPGREKLFLLAQEYVKIEENKRDLIQAQVVNLAENFVDFEWILHFLDFTKESFPVRESSGLNQIFNENSGDRFSDVLLHSGKLHHFFLTVHENLPKVPNSENTEIAALTRLLEKMDGVGSRSHALALFPPSTAQDAQSEWFTPADVMNRVLSGKGTNPDQIHSLKLLEDLMDHRENPQLFQSIFADFHSQIKQLATSRGEYEKIKLEVFFYKGKFFYYGLVLFVISFLILALSWLKPKNRILNLLAKGSLLTALLSLTVGIVLRCVIRSRPPISTLYETVLFITAIAVILSLVIEFINRQRIAESIGAFLGMVGLFLANKYEIKEGTDTMTSLVAVLDSNYWLATHVTTVTIGYAAGLLAGAIGHIYIVGKFLGIKRNDKKFYKTVTKMVYGVLCFGLFFSIVGTILGGIWANDSWGRFWGWDPKENGALMIILWELTILHARMGGYIRDLGISITAIFGGCIVAFSWWGVNLLGVGLHSYGFTSGIFNALVLFYGAESLVIILGFILWFRGKTTSFPIPPTPSNIAST